MLPKKRRVNKELFELIMKNGLIISGQFFVFRYLKPESTTTGVGHLASQVSNTWGIYHLSCVAPKSVAKRAVDRNKLRRRAYLALGVFPIKQGSGILFYKKTGVSASAKELRDDIEFLLKKAYFI